MSSILKALQKLESETRERDAGPAWLKNFNAGQGLLEKRERVLGKPLMALICVGLILSAAIAFIFIKKQRQFTISFSGSQPVQNSGEVTTKNESLHTADRLTATGSGTNAPGTTKVKSGRPPQNETTKEDIRPVPENTVAGVNTGAARESNPAGMPVVAGDTNKRGSAFSEKPAQPVTGMLKKAPSHGDNKVEAPHKTPESSKKSSQVSATEIPAAAVNANRENGALESEIETAVESPDTLSAQRLHNPELKLHAISWTPDANTRLAVVNGSIVREGDRINSYFVFRINKDDIVLRENGELWRLLFDTR